MSQPSLPSPGEIASYLQPTVRDRLVNYYASDDVFNRVQATLAIPDLAAKITVVDQLSAYSKSIQWYDSVSASIYEIVQRTAPITNIADNLGGVTGELKDVAASLAGQVISQFFSKVGDLVGIHDNLQWIGQAANITAASNLYQRAGYIASIVDFIEGNTTAGTNRWVMLQNYLSDAWYPGLQALQGLKDDIGNVIGAVRGVSASEGITTRSVSDRLKWYLTGSVIQGIGSLTERLNPLKFIADHVDFQNGVIGGFVSGNGGPLLQWRGEHRLFDLGDWLDPWELMDVSPTNFPIALERDSSTGLGARFGPHIIRNRIQNRLNGYLGDFAILAVFQDFNQIPKPWIKGMMAIREVPPDSLVAVTRIIPVLLSLFILVEKKLWKILA